MGHNKLYDHKGSSIIKIYDIWRIHYCIMHATIPFGKDITKYMHEIIVGDNENLKKLVDVFFHKYNINISFVKGPSKSKQVFNIKATHTWALLNNFSEFCEIVRYTGELIILVPDLIRYLKIVYKVNQDS